MTPELCRGFLSALSFLHAQRFQLLLDRPLRPIDCARVVAQIVGEVRAEEERVELERKLRGIDGRIEVSFVDSHANRFLERADPIVHQSTNRVAHDTGTSIEFERRGREKTSTGKNAASQIKNVDTVIPGHSPLTDWKAFEEFTEFNRAFLDAVQQAKKDGKSAEDAAAGLKLPDKFKDFGTQRLKDNVTKIYTELK